VFLLKCFYILGVTGQTLVYAAVDLLVAKGEFLVSFKIRWCIFGKFQMVRLMLKIRVDQPKAMSVYQSGAVMYTICRLSLKHTTTPSATLPEWTTSSQWRDSRYRPWRTLCGRLSSRMRSGDLFPRSQVSRKQILCSWRLPLESPIYYRVAGQLIHHQVVQVPTRFPAATSFTQTKYFLRRSRCWHSICSVYKIDTLIKFHGYRLVTMPFEMRSV
jgi:hypothetical protein